MTGKGKQKNDPWLYVDLPETDYDRVRRLQIQIVEAKREGILSSDVVLFVEHPPVFTLGRRGGRENLIISDADLKKSGIPVIPVERGGDITFHGPGQLVVYPIIDLKVAKLSLAAYVSRLEEVMIRTAGEWGVRAARDERNRGVWVGDKKLGSIGVAVRRWITFHGFSLNVNVSLEPFSWIHPCGLKEIGVTSMACELSRNVTPNAVKETVRRHLGDVFEIALSPLQPLILELRLDDARTDAGGSP